MHFLSVPASIWQEHAAADIHDGLTLFTELWRRMTQTRLMRKSFIRAKWPMSCLELKSNTFRAFKCTVCVGCKLYICAIASSTETLSLIIWGMRKMRRMRTVVLRRLWCHQPPKISSICLFYWHDSNRHLSLCFKIKQPKSLIRGHAEKKKKKYRALPFYINTEKIKAKMLWT